MAGVVYTYLILYLSEWLLALASISLGWPTPMTSDCFKYPFATSEDQNLLTRAVHLRQLLSIGVADAMRPSTARDNVWNARLSVGLLIF